MVSFAGSSVFGIIISLVAIAILIYNVVYVSAVRNALNQGGANIPTGLSATSANVLFWIDIGLIVLLGIYLLYNIYVIFTTQSDREKLREALLRSQSGYGAGLLPTRADTVAVRRQ
uniref:Uncharacterized protein n=1 Tax=viral metagenome TaxID=1070528 RepID=A0A6C0IZT3_9ZZZZ